MREIASPANIIVGFYLQKQKNCPSFVLPHCNTKNRFFFLILSYQVAECHQDGRECIMVTSGAVAFGKQKLTQELLMSLSMRETLSPNDAARKDVRLLLEPRAAAAVGQSGLMSLYDAMFSQYGVKIAQVLVTKPDFYNDETRKNLFSTLSELISMNIVPIINTNDAVTPPPQDDELIKSKGKKVCYNFVRCYKVDGPTSSFSFFFHRPGLFRDKKIFLRKNRPTNDGCC